MAEPVIIVSGLPRSGTSMMMQMLDFGGIEAVTDRLRQADTDNPRGYYEYEAVKKVKTDASWLPATRGKAVKMVSQLLRDLPPSEQYQVIFMERDFEEMLISQEKMLQRLGRPAGPRDRLRSSFKDHLDRLFQWLDKQCNMTVLRMNYNQLLASPELHAESISRFLGRELNLAAMIKAVDRSLYRNRVTASS